MDFRYIADDKSGKRVTDVTTAETADLAVQRLNAQGLLPIKVVPDALGRRQWLQLLLPMKGQVSSKELSIFTRQMAATLGAGLLLTEALEAVADDLENRYFQMLIINIRDDIMAGTNFSTALAKYPTIFPKSYHQVIRSGEATGRLQMTMGSLAQYLEKMQRVKDKVKGAMQYPLFIFQFTVVVVGILVAFLVPKFKEIFTEAGAQLPLLTQIVLGFSDFVLHNAIWLLIFSGMAAVGGMYAIRQPQMQPHMDYWKLRVPLLGRDVFHKALVSSFCRTFGFLLSSGVELSASLEIVAQAVNHDLMEKTIRQVRRRVMAGGSLSESMREHRLFPRLVRKMVSVGEKSGKLPEMLSRTADYYDEELEATVQGLLTLIEPVMIVVVGVLIGIVVLALYLPIFKVSSLVR